MGFWRASLRRVGLRVTPQRLAVLVALDEHPHSDAATVASDIGKASDAAVTLQGAHVILQQLCVAGLIRRVELPGSASAVWETRVGDNHHHVQCVVCGRIEDVDCVVGEAPCLTPSEAHGMKILEASIVFRGICSECERAGRAAQAEKVVAPAVGATRRGTPASHPSHSSDRSE